MIISHAHKYVFVELPRTGSTAISRELCQCYEGTRILHKHSTYHEFLKTASEEEKQYFVFSCIRNPLDDAVSHYFKLKTNHRERYTDEEKLKRRKRLAERVDTALYQFIQENDADFETFFRKFYVVPYNNWASMARKHYDFIIRFENLQGDFARVIEMLGLELQRPLPARNVTTKRKREYHTYYTPAIIPRAKRVFGPFMKQWGYEFPAGWGNGEIPWWNQLEFEVLNLFRFLYWGYFRRLI